MPASPATFCQLQIGAIEVTFVPDGYIYSSPLTSFPGSTPEMWAANGHLLDADGMVVMSLGALLVRTAGKLVMVDLGWGPSTLEYGQNPDGTSSGRMGGGDLITNLAALGVAPGDVDAVLFSHLHADHTGWIVDPATATGNVDEPGQAAFSNAAHYLSAAEWDYWSTRTPVGTGPEPTREQLAVLGTRISVLADGETPFPGIDVIATPGHTPGHLSFVISSGSDRAVVLGDAVHCPIEIAQPELSFVADVDPAMAQRTRIHIEQELTRPGTFAAGTHFADLVFGRLLKGEGRTSWHFPDSQILAVGA